MSRLRVRAIAANGSNTVSAESLTETAHTMNTPAIAASVLDPGFRNAQTATASATSASTAAGVSASIWVACTGYGGAIVSNAAAPKAGSRPSGRAHAQAATTPTSAMISIPVRTPV